MKKYRPKNVEEISKTLKPPWPHPELPHVAIAGRSNVGKSSLVNKLTSRKKLAGVGKTPGKTKALQFFRVDHKFILCDLPGYGYAKVSKQLRSLWQDAVLDYFDSDPGPAGIIILMDARHAPAKLDEQIVADVLPTGIPWMPVLTKADKVPRGQRRKVQMRVSETLKVDGDMLAWTSSVTGEGIETLWQEILELTGQVK